MFATSMLTSVVRSSIITARLVDLGGAMSFKVYDGVRRQYDGTHMIGSTRWTGICRAKPGPTAAWREYHGENQTHEAGD